MNHIVETLAELDRGQIIRLTLTEGTQIEGRSNQYDYVPDESLRIELSSDESGDYNRYQLRAHVTADAWTPVEVHGFDSEHDESTWRPLGSIDEVELVDDHRMMDSDVDTGHEG